MDWYSHRGKPVGGSSKKSDTESPHAPAIPLLVAHASKTKTYVSPKTGTQILTAALFMMVNKEATHEPVGGWMDKPFWSTCTMGW